MVIPYGVSAPTTMYQNPDVITKTAEEFLSESLEYVTFEDEIFGCFTSEILIEFGCVEMSSKDSSQVCLGSICSFHFFVDLGYQMRKRQWVVRANMAPIKYEERNTQV